MIKHLRLYLFGSFRVERDSQPVHLPTRKIESLYAYLALHPGPHAREKIAALFWGDSPDAGARNSLRVALTKLRHALGQDLLLTDRAEVQINPGYPLWVDALEFSRQGNQFLADDGMPPDLELYQDDLLNDFYEDWVVAARHELRQLYFDILLHLVQQARSRGEYELAIGFARQVLHREPENEEAHQHLMFCFASLGNRSAALAQFVKVEHVLKTELDVEPSLETRALYEWIKLNTGQRHGMSGEVTNLPVPLTPFIGRERGTHAVKEQLAHARLLTLTGAGGVEKRGLAIHVATELLDRFADGVWWVELGGVADGSFVSQIVANVLGVRDTFSRSGTSLLKAIADSMQGKQLLLVLDNCEHLIGACVRVADALLGALPHLRILTSSREPLGITGEVVWRVPSLSTPAVADLDVHTTELVPMLADFEAVRLFVERANDLNRGFRLTEQNAFAIAQICERLDGLPLAIELAAARTDLLSPQEIAARLNQRFQLLTKGSRAALPRQQTLRATLDWSHDLLTAEERVLFRRLSVFVDGFTLEAVESVMDDEQSFIPHPSSGAQIFPPSFPGEKSPTPILDLLSRLVDKSLVVVEMQDELARYHLLQTIGEYASEKLHAAHETQARRERHLDYFVRFAIQARLKLRGPAQARMWSRLDREQPNFRAALSWALASGAIEKGLRLADALTPFWYERDLSEGMRLLDQLLAAASQTTNTALRARALYDLGWLAEEAGSSSDASIRLRESATLFRALMASRKGRTNKESLDEYKLGLAHALIDLARAIRSTADAVTLRALADEGLNLAREVGAEWELAMALQSYGHIVRSAVGVSAAHDAYAESLARFRRLGDTTNIASVLANIGLLMHLEGKSLDAVVFLDESLGLSREIGSNLGIAMATVDLAYAAATTGDYNRARKLAHESIQLSRRLGFTPGVFGCLITIGILACEQEEFNQAARLFALASRLGKGMSQTGNFTNRPAYKDNLWAARDALGEQEFALEWEKGQAMSVDEVVGAARI